MHNAVCTHYSLFESNLTLVRVLIACFWAIAFVQSGADKLFNSNDNLTWLKEHFSKTALKNYVYLLFLFVLLLEVITALLAVASLASLLMPLGNIFLFLNVSAACTLLMLFAGQRISKDYEGAKTLVIYLIIALVGIITA